MSSELETLFDVDREIERLAKVLGGGWRLDHGVVPVIVLMLNEAQALEKRLQA